MKLKLILAMLVLAQFTFADESGFDATRTSVQEQPSVGNKSQSNASVLTADEKILRTNAALKSYKEFYVDSPGNKAFAQSPEGHWNWRSDRVTLEQAQEDALSSCNKHVGKGDRPCVIININGEWIRPQQ